MPETVRYPDRDAPGVMIEGHVVRRVDSDDGEWCLCQPTHDGHGAAIRRGERYQQWVHADDVESVMKPTYDSWRPRQR